MTISQVIRLFIFGRGKEKYDSLQSLPSILRLTWDILDSSNKPGSKDCVAATFKGHLFIVGGKAEP